MTLQYRSTNRARFLKRTLLALLVGSCFAGVQAAPSTPQVVSGQATFSQNGNVFSITNTPNTVINWQSFSVNAGEVTRFIQQSSDSAVLNRIVGHDPSQILGALQSNGRVFLINPNGILFGRESRVDVNGLTASTLAMTDFDFLSGKKQFGGGARAGAIVNQGSITTPSGGQVFLIASNVENSGIITSPQGQVVLAAGHSVQLVDSSNPSLHVVVSAPADQAVNLGQVIAQGGKVGIYGALVNQRGVVNANSAHMGENGKIVLRASRDAVLAAGSVTTATGAGRGGDVSVEGERVGMMGNARIDASGATGGGSVLLGGGYQGKNPLLRNAQHTMLGKHASIKADAIDSGNGGTVVLWSDHSTRALGQISARGGNASGNGGLVETSGKYLDVNGIGVQAGARNGANGTWLLDPYDIEIVATGGEAQLSDADQFGDPMTRATVNASTISSVAPGTNVVLQAQHDVIFWSAINPALGSGSLIVEAGNSIFVNAAIGTGGGAVGMTANHPNFASGSGVIAINAGGSIDTGGGDVILNGSQVTLGGPVVTRNGRLTIHGGNHVAIEQNIDTGSGELHVGANSISFGGTGTTATGGFMSFHNMGGMFTLGPNWTLASPEAINVHADTMSLLGTIGPSQSTRPHVGLMTHTPGRAIDIVSGTGSLNLSLDPAALMRFDASSIHIGNPGHAGDITVMSEYSGGRAERMSLQTQGNIAINAPLILPSGVQSGLMLMVTGGNPQGSITTAPDIMSAAVIPGGRLAADHIELRANNMSIGAAIRAGGASGAGFVSLMPHTATSSIAIGGGAADGFDMLGLLDSELRFITARGMQIGGTDGQKGGLTVMPGGMDFSTILPLESELRLIGGFGKVTLGGNLTVPGFLFMEGQELHTTFGASAKAQGMRLQSHFGIGNDSTPFVTQTGFLSASNESVDGVAPINISNTGELELGAIHQNGSGNQGAITIANAGGMSVIGGDPNFTAPTIFTGGNGNITLKTMSPLSIFGDIGTQSGAIMLEAGNGGVLSIGPDASVDSISGNISLVGGALINDGKVSTGAGNITITAPAVAGTGTYAAPGGTITGLPVKDPTVIDCLNNAAIIGCTAVLKKALDACIVTPAGPNCLALLPSLTVCTASPATYGCSVVLPTLSMCIAKPDAPGCSAVLPTLTVCTATPSTLGCAVVLPTLAQCVGSPTLQGCTAVLPTLATCTAAPSTAGCAVVLPTLATCTAAPSTAGCAVVLPTLATCTAAPSTAGCVAVLPTLATCTVAPATAGCAVVLPTLAQCVGNPVLQGCTAVLPTLAECASTPSAPGCAVVLQPVTAAPDSKLEEAIKVTVDALAQSKETVVVGASEEKKEEKKDDSARADVASLQGEKKDAIPKTYCN